MSHQEGRPNPIPPSGYNEGRWVLTEEILQGVPFAKLFSTGPEDDSLKTDKNSTALSVESMC